MRTYLNNSTYVCRRNSHRLRERKKNLLIFGIGVIDKKSFHFFTRCTLPVQVPYVRMEFFFFSSEGKRIRSNIDSPVQYIGWSVLEAVMLIKSR